MQMLAHFVQFKMHSNCFIFKNICQVEKQENSKNNNKLKRHNLKNGFERAYFFAKHQDRRILLLLLLLLNNSMVRAWFFSSLSNANSTTLSDKKKKKNV